MTGIISQSESGVDLVFEWKIQEADFLDFWDGDNSYCQSPSFSFGGAVWCLIIYPTGSFQKDTPGYVDLELCKLNSNSSIIQSFSLSFKTAKDEKYNEQHFIKEFGSFPDNFHEILRFTKRTAFTRRRSELLPEGVLTVVCTMKSSTSAGSASCAASACSESHHCRQASDAVILSSHRNKCIHKRVKCLDCLAVIEFDEHECQKKRTEAVKDLEHEDAHTQTVGASIWTLENSTQTVGGKCETFASGSSTNPQENKVLHDLKELFFNKKDCDVIIKVKGSEFPAHRVILKARSPVFASTFQHDMKENTAGMLEIKDCDPSIYSDLLCFLYCGDVSIISQENVFGLFTAADKYQVLDLKAKCLEFMKKNITVDNFCETISLALRHSETELIELCTDYFKKNVPKIIVTVKWQTFLAENPTESNELFIKFFVPNSSS